MALCLCKLAGDDEHDTARLALHARSARQVAEVMAQPTDFMVAECGDIPVTDAWPRMMDAILAEGL